MRTTSLALGTLVLLACAACGGGSGSGGGAQTGGAGTGTTTTDTGGAGSTGGAAAVSSLQVSTESLNVDKVGPADGALKPDGSKDLAFTADVNGPIAALFLVSTDASGSPDGSFHANTLVGNQEAPQEFKGELERGKFSAGMGVFENGTLQNKDDGSLKPLGPGKHTLAIYTANTGTMTSGGHARLYATGPDGKLVAGPVIALP